MKRCSGISTKSQEWTDKETFVQCWEQTATWTEMGISHGKKGEWVDRTSLINRRLTTNQGYTLPFL